MHFVRKLNLIFALSNFKYKIIDFANNKIVLSFTCIINYLYKEMCTDACAYVWVYIHQCLPHNCY